MLVKKCVIVNMWLNVREIKQIAYLLAMKLLRFDVSKSDLPLFEVNKSYQTE